MRLIGHELLIAIQSYSSPTIDAFFRAVTDIGHEYAYLLILIALYWCVDRRVGHGAVVLFLASMWLNGALKELFATARPDPAAGVRVLVEETSFGFPSGHAQGVMTLWGYLALAFGSRIFRIIAVLIILLVGFSRLVLGAHFLADVLGGYGVGMLMIALYIAIRSLGLGRGLPWGLKLLLSLVVPLVLIPVYQSDASFQVLGFYMGWFAGSMAAFEALPYDPHTGFLRQAAKLVLGLAGVGLLYFLHSFLPEGLLESFGYAVIAVWVTVAAPWLFIRLGLARPFEPARAKSPLFGSRRAAKSSLATIEPFHPSGTRGIFSSAAGKRSPLRTVTGVAAWVAVALAVLTIIAPGGGVIGEGGGALEATAGRRGLLGPAIDGAAPRILAHRGFSGAAPENTLEAVERARALGVWMIEFDVHLTADGHLVVIHDDRVDRTTDGQGAVAEMTLEELRTLDAGYRFTPDGRSFPFRGTGLRIPTLEEVLEASGDVPLLIELKSEDPRAARRLAEILRDRGDLDRVVVASFHHPVVAAARELMPGVPTMASQDEALWFVILSRLGLAAFARAEWDALSLPPKYGWFPVITPGLVEAAHERGAPVYAWTINDTDEARRLAAMGVDGIISDLPDRVREAVTRPSHP